MGFGPLKRRGDPARATSTWHLAPTPEPQSKRGPVRLGGVAGAIGLIAVIALVLGLAGLRQITPGASAEDDPAAVAPAQEAPVEAAPAQEAPAQEAPAQEAPVVEVVDSDGDGLADDADNCPWVANSDQTDSDGNWIGDACDAPPPPPDSDGDGVSDDLDNCTLVPNGDQTDTDGNWIGDACDAPPPPPDSDGDGLGDDVDNCTLVPNADQADADLNGIGDACDAPPPPPDGDADGIEDAADNCLEVANADQTDADGDGAGDACDTVEPEPSPTPVASTEPEAAPSPTPESTPYEEANKYASGGPDVPGVAFPYPAPFVITEDVYPVVARINAGGGAVAIGDQLWDADTGYESGKSATHGSREIYGTDADSVFRDQRTGTDSGEGFSYQIPVPAAGPYLVRLSFAELSRKDGAPLESGIGKRVMNVSLEGGVVLDGFDIAVASGLASALVLPFQVDVVDGVLNIDFGASRARPVVSAIEVLRIPSGEHWVDVDRTTNQVHLMIGDVVVASYRAMMSREAGGVTNGTNAGSYIIHNKHVGLLYTPYAHNYFAYWASFDPGREEGFHSWVMDKDGNVVPGGDGYTLGCIATSVPDSAEIFSFLEVGMRVEIHW